MESSSVQRQLIANLIGAELLTKNSATTLGIKKRSKPKILHIASHSYFLEDKRQETKKKATSLELKSKNDINKNIKYIENPLIRSGIVLAGANNPEVDKNDDGYLTSLEVTKLDWEGTEMVVISGCESGLGDIKSGEGVYGLKRAISVAGAKTSLLSLWKVNDLATVEFMNSFYLKLKKGEGRSKALSNTQKEFRNHQIPGYRHPNVWAAFQLSGDWRPIDF